jgi:uncharacterized membrane protein YcjF (UPF0283 family)
LFGRPIFPSLGQHFGAIGLVLLLFGLGVTLFSFILALDGWSTEQLWIYYLASASFVLVGIQLIIAWVQMQVFDTLRIREELTTSDLHGKEAVSSDAMPRSRDVRAELIQPRT